MANNPFALLRRLPRTVRILIAGTFVNKVGTFIIPYLTLVLRREFHLSAEAVGQLVLAYGAGSFVSILVGGALADRLGRRVALLVSLLGGGALALGLGAAPDLGTFAALLVAFGFVSDLYRPAASAIIADELASSQRALGFAGLPR